MQFELLKNQYFSIGGYIYISYNTKYDMLDERGNCRMLIGSAWHKGRWSRTLGTCPNCLDPRQVRTIEFEEVWNCSDPPPPTAVGTKIWYKFAFRPKNALKWQNINKEGLYLSYLRPLLCPNFEKKIIWVGPLPLDKFPNFAGIFGKSCPSW